MAAGVSAEDAAAGDQMAEAATPMAAEPITADTMSTLAAVLPEAISRITGGAIGPEMVTIPQGDVAGDRLPGAAAKHLLAVAGLVQTTSGQVKGIERYALTPDELTTNNGIVEAALKVDALSRDKAVVDALANATIAPPGGQEDGSADPDNR